MMLIAAANDDDERRYNSYAFTTGRRERKSEINAMADDGRRAALGSAESASTSLLNVVRDLRPRVAYASISPDRDALPALRPKADQRFTDTDVVCERKTRSWTINIGKL